MAPPLPVPRPLPPARGQQPPTPAPAPSPAEAPVAESHGAVPVYFISDSTGISAETMGNALLAQFPTVPFERRLIPFLRTAREAEEVREQLDEVMDGPVEPIVFLTVVDEEVREVPEFHAGRPVAVHAVHGRCEVRLHGLGVDVNVEFRAGEVLNAGRERLDAGDDVITQHGEVLRVLERVLRAQHDAEQDPGKVRGEGEDVAVAVAVQGIVVQFGVHAFSVRGRTVTPQTPVTGCPPDRV